MTILQGQDAWHRLDRWNQPCGRPTYRTAVLELAPGLLTHGIAIAVTYDTANFLWNAADPDDQSQLENLWSGFLVEGKPEPLIPYGGCDFFLAFQPASGASTWRPASPGHADPEPYPPLARPALTSEAGRAVLDTSPA